MKIAIAQIEVRPAMVAANLKRALSALDEARGQGAEIVLFPEMVLPGYLIGDIWEQHSFLRDVLSAQDELAASSGDAAVAFGGLGVDWDCRGEDGRPRKFNACFVAQRGRLVPPEAGPYPFSIKTLMPNYREFEDSRHFYDNRKLALEKGCNTEDLISPHAIEGPGGQRLLLGGTLCEDSWDADYSFSPLDILAAKGAEVLVNLSCSPFTRGKPDKRRRVFENLAKRIRKPIFFCNNVGIQNNGKTVYVFDGRSAAYSADGKEIFALPLFEEKVEVVDLQDAAGGRAQARPSKSEPAVLLDALCYGTRKFLDLTGVGKVVIGLSGGVDSALAASVYARILPPEDILLVNMPSRYNTATTRGAARRIAENLDCYYAVVGIEESVKLTLAQMKGMIVERPIEKVRRTLDFSPLAVENIQARDRSSRILAALASAFGGAFTCNANKSEATVGYATFYGDLGGFFANLADLWKWQIYELAKEVNSRAGREILPPEVFAVKPSAELSDEQNPEKGGGDPIQYPYHDALFRTWVEDWDRKTPEDALLWYRDGVLPEKLGVSKGIVKSLFSDSSAFVADLERWWRCYAGIGVAKRIQAPPLLALSRRAFGFDHREAQSGPYFTKAYEELKKEVLARR